jgi:hypothetical protein
MIIRTPRFIEQFFYAAIDPRARVGDEALAISIGNRYAGIYPTSTGFEVAMGKLGQHGQLV